MQNIAQSYLFTSYYKLLTQGEHLLHILICFHTASNCEAHSFDIVSMATQNPIWVTMGILLQFPVKVAVIGSLV